MQIRNFEDLEIWKEARRLTREVYGFSKGSKFAKDFGLRDQMQRAAVSIMSNIAEGSGLLAKPPGEGPFPAVALLHTCGGLTSVTTLDWPEYLTGLGYVTLSVDSFGSRGIKRCPTPLSRDRRELSRDAYGALTI